MEKYHTTMNSKERIKTSLNHKQPDQLPVDFGSAPVTGIHVWAVERLRDYYGLEKKLVKVIEPYQMLGEVDDDLAEVIGIDTIGVSPQKTMFGFENNNWKEFETFWGQKVLVPGNFNTKIDDQGDLLMFPEGDTSAPPSAKMPQASFFFDTIIRQEPIEEDKLNPEDNLEEFGDITDNDLTYWKNAIGNVKDSGKAIVANLGGTALGDIALVPAPGMKYPKGIRDISEWYMSTMMRPDYVKEIFDKQSAIAVKNLEKIFKTVGNDIDVVFICGTDFGTQESTFCDEATYRDLWLPYYQRINAWIHKNTAWKTFKHSCGAVESFMNLFIESGFDIINPVQINAKGMDSKLLKEKYGDRLTFWGGGIDTQKVLSFGTPQEVKKQTLEQCKVFAKNGGFVFNSVHNVQANTPTENLAAMIEGLNEFRGLK